MNKTLKIGGDLHPTPVDERDFGLIDFFPQIDISEVPDTDWNFYEPLEIKDQGQTQECTGHGVAEAIEAHEGVIINPSVQYALIKDIVGSPTDDGADLRSAMKSGTKYGAVEKKDCDLGVTNHDGEFLADLKNYPTNVKDLAKKHQQRSFFSIGGRYDAFDNLRVALWQHKAELDLGITGVGWRDNWTDTEKGVVPTEAGVIDGGHCISALPRQKLINGELHLAFMVHYGKEIGDGGIFWFPREVINRDFTYGFYMYKDKDPEECKQFYQLKKGNNVMPTLKKVWDWLVISSADPEKTALTVKGFLNMVASALLIVSPLFHLHVTADQTTATIELSGQVLVLIYGAVSTLTTIFGLIRKIANTWRL